MQRTFEGGYEILENYRNLDEDVRKLMEEAKLARDNSYSPYSKFAIGVAVKLSNGLYVHGSNQENISFPATLCAERVALHNVMQNFPNEKVLSLAIIGTSREKWTESVITPCGICRQTMAEVVVRQKETFSIYLGTDEHETLYIPRAEYLLPLSFSHEDLKK